MHASKHSLLKNSVNWITMARWHGSKNFVKFWFFNFGSSKVGSHKKWNLQGEVWHENLDVRMIWASVKGRGRWAPTFWHSGWGPYQCENWALLSLQRQNNLLYEANWTIKGTPDDPKCLFVIKTGRYLWENGTRTHATRTKQGVSANIYCCPVDLNIPHNVWPCVNLFCLKYSEAPLKLLVRITFCPV